MYYRILSKIYEGAAKKMCLDCQDFIQRGSKILDLGCGSGIVGNQFKEFFQAEFFGTDIIDRRAVPLDFEIFDGKNLPFPEKSFDVVLINYVLHHSEDPISVLKEAKRVARDKIVIYEDLPEDILSKLICQLHGISFDNFFGNPTKTSFKSEREWEKIFKGLGLNIIFKKRVNNFPAKKELFILGV